MMTYDEAVRYILDIPRFTKKNDAQHTRTFLEYLGDPQENFRVLHVAGTNGKGSVCVYLDAMLRAEGKKTGRFTSPHLVKVNERIAVDGKNVSDDLFCEAFHETYGKVQKMMEAGLSHPTFFEFLLGMAMIVFAREKAEYVILETGLGGRLDATNAVERPEACVITSIGMDHMQYLGNTLAEIAGEKAGIIKEGVPVFFAETCGESDSVIARRAREQHSFCKKIGKDAYEILGIEDKHIAFSCSNAYYGNTTWKLNNIGACQPGNAMLAMETMRYLFGENAHPQRWREALSQVMWEGRMEEILPDVYIDGAHNISAVEAFVSSVPGDGRGNIILFSAVRDKEYEKMISCLCGGPDADLYIVTQIRDARAADADELGRVFREHTDKPVRVMPSLQEAFAYARREQKGRRIWCLGSLYLTGMIKELIREDA